MSDDLDKIKITQTIKAETESWLLETYPDADGTQEAIRMAISDARLVRDAKHVHLQRPPETDTETPGDR